MLRSSTYTVSYAASILLAWFAALTLPGAQAAVPVEDMSTSGAQQSPVTVATPEGPAVIDGATITTPQPVLPDARVLQQGSAGYPGYESEPIAGGSVADSGALQVQPGQNAQLFYELQQLQTELLQLRGVVENQAYEIKRLQDLQRSQYLDIDRRLAGQSPTSGGSGESLAVRDTPGQDLSVPQDTSAQQPAVLLPAIPPSTPQVPVVQTGEAENSLAAAPLVTEETAVATDVVSVQTTVVSEPTPVVAAEPEPALVPTEQEAYARAFELMKDQQFEQSIAAYQGVIQQFPGGNYAPESRYWLGELYLMSDRLEDARGSFNSVIDEFPAHQKVPLSLYKLGVVNHRLGGTTEALTYLDDVVVRYPDTPAAGLARTYAAELR